MRGRFLWVLSADFAQKVPNIRTASGSDRPYTHSLWGDTPQQTQPFFKLTLGPVATAPGSDFRQVGLLIKGETREQILCPTCRRDAHKFYQH
jgi:hypothetical protein